MGAQGSVRHEAAVCGARSCRRGSARANAVLLLAARAVSAGAGRSQGRARGPGAGRGARAPGPGVKDRAAVAAARIQGHGRPSQGPARHRARSRGRARTVGRACLGLGRIARHATRTRLLLASGARQAGGLSVADGLRRYARAGRPGRCRRPRATPRMECGARKTRTGDNDRRRARRRLARDCGAACAQPRPGRCGARRRARRGAARLCARAGAERASPQCGDTRADPFLGALQ